MAEAVFSLEFCISILGAWNQRRFFLRTRDEDSALLIKTFLARLHFSLCLTSFQFFRGVWKYFPWCFPNPTSLQRDVCFRICDENYALLMKTFLSRWHFTKPPIFWLECITFNLPLIASLLILSELIELLIREGGGITSSAKETGFVHWVVKYLLIEIIFC